MFLIVIYNIFYIQTFLMKYIIIVLIKYDFYVRIELFS